MAHITPRALVRTVARPTGRGRVIVLGVRNSIRHQREFEEQSIKDDNANVTQWLGQVFNRLIHPSIDPS